MENYLWIFVHLFKSGGTTLKTHLSRHFDEDVTYIELSKWGEKYRHANNRQPLKKRSLEQRRLVQVIAGHRVHYGIHELIPQKKPKYFTIMRDPAERCLSTYNFHRSRGRTDFDFATWYQRVYNRKHCNFITQFYARRYSCHPLSTNNNINFKLAKKFIDKCWFVGLTNELDHDLRYIFQKMQLPITYQNYRVAVDKNHLSPEKYGHPHKHIAITKHQLMTQEIRHNIYHDHPLDYDLFQYAKNVRLDTLC